MIMPSSVTSPTVSLDLIPAGIHTKQAKHPGMEVSMKRFLGMAAAYWLRKPENRRKAKRTAKQIWSRFQGRGDTRGGNGQRH